MPKCDERTALQVHALQVHVVPAPAERPTVSDSPGPPEPGVSRRRRKRLLPLVGYESSNKSEELVSTTGSLQERASHREEEIKPIPISKVMKAWDSKAKAILLRY